MSPSTWASLRARLGRDEGASLVLTLMFVVGTGVMLGALLTYANTAINTAKATQGRHQLSADVSGAMDVAINELRKSTYADSTQPCPTTVPANVPGADGKPIRIVCLPKVGSGTSAGTVPINKVNHPGAAVLTLAPIQVAPGQTEAGLTKSDNSRLRIKGGVYVNSNIDASGSGTTCQDLQSANCTAIDVEQAGVLAKGSCLPAARVVATTAPYTVSCSVAGTAKASDPLLKDPALLTDTDLPHGTAIAAGYAQPPSTIDKLGLQVVPTLCPPVGQAVELNPGYYDDAVALTDLTSTCNRAFHFAPGVYYFDFRNEEMAGIAAGSRPIGWSNNVKNVWTINNGSADFYVVGGTTKDWSAGKPTTFPGSCVSPLTSTANNEGVQFVFGGSSRIDLQQGQVELCGQYSLDRPALVLYGAKTGTTIQQALRASTPTAVAPSSAFVSTPPGAELQRLSSVDGALATAPITRAASGTTTATVRLTGMDAASQIPPGSILTTAELRVTHKETTASSSDALAVSVLPNPGRTGTAPVASTGTATISGTMTTQTTDLKNALMKEVWRNGLSNVQIDYSVIAAQATVPLPKLTADLDAAQLYLAWTPPIAARADHRDQRRQLRWGRATGDDLPAAADQRCRRGLALPAGHHVCPVGDFRPQPGQCQRASDEERHHRSLTERLGKSEHVVHPAGHRDSGRDRRRGDHGGLPGGVPVHGHRNGVRVERSTRERLAASRTLDHRPRQRIPGTHRRDQAGHGDQLACARLAQAKRMGKCRHRDASW
ncbi:MAG TPA: hypothetical protein VIM26_24795 [Pengzhenrongella sp.]